MVRPEEIQIAVFAFRCQPNRMLAEWLDWTKTLGCAVRYASEVRGIDLAREQECNRLLTEDAPAGRPYLLMIDADMVPVAETLPILTAPGEIIYCGYVGHQGGRGHSGDNDFGCACCRIHADALRRMEKPWFDFDRTGDILRSCECSWFAKRAQVAGVSPQMIGGIGHLQQVVMMPGGTSFWPRECGGRGPARL